MSKYQKSKKARRPNIPMPSGAVGGGAEAATETVSTPMRAQPATINFDYSHIKSDLTRIFTLAGIFIAVLVGLSFILK
jgi:hypothetical protein